MSRASELLRDIQNLQEAQDKYNRTHPPITARSVEEADTKRSFQYEGIFVTCDLPCCGMNIPANYNHKGSNRPQEELKQLEQAGWDMSVGSDARTKVCDINGRFCLTPFTT